MKKNIFIVIFALVSGYMYAQTNECDIIQQMDIQVMPQVIPYMFNNIDTLIINMTNFYTNDNEKIRNQSITTGNSYIIEYLSNNTWTRIPLKNDFEGNAIKLLFNIPRYFKIPLHKKMHHYYPGQYRIVKEINIKDFYMNGKIKNASYRVYSYFSIKRN